MHVRGPASTPAHGEQHVSSGSCTHTRAQGAREARGTPAKQASYRHAHAERAQHCTLLHTASTARCRIPLAVSRFEQHSSIVVRVQRQSARRQREGLAARYRGMIERTPVAAKMQRVNGAQQEATCSQ